MGLSGFLQLTRPRLAGIESLSPIEVWSVWQDLRRGPDRNLSPTEQRFLELLGIHRVWQTALLAAVCAGLILMAIAYAIPGPQPSRRSAPRGNDPRLYSTEGKRNANL